MTVRYNMVSKDTTAGGGKLLRQDFLFLFKIFLKPPVCGESLS